MWRKTPPSWSTIEVEPLPVLMDAHELGEFDTGRATEPTIVRHSFGDIDAAFAKAHAVVELELTIGRHSGVPMETRGAIGRYDAARDVLELHGAAKVPHRNKDTLVRMLRRSPHSHPSVRGPYRRRLRHSRRALPRGRAGAARGACGSAGR